MYSKILVTHYKHWIFETENGIIKIVKKDVTYSWRMSNFVESCDEKQSGNAVITGMIETEELNKSERQNKT